MRETLNTAGIDRLQTSPPGASLSTPIVKPSASDNAPSPAAVPLLAGQL